MNQLGDHDLFARFNAKPPADSAAIARCQSALNFQLPPEYVRFLQRMNGGEGFVGEHYLIVWSVEELIQDNKECKGDFGGPEFFLFASDGGGEAFAFDVRSSPPSIVMVPFIGLSSEDAIPVAADFDAFLQRLYHSESLFEP